MCMYMYIQAHVHVDVIEHAEKLALEGFRLYCCTQLISI